MRIRILMLALISVFSVRGFAQDSKTLLVDRPLGGDPVTIVKVMEGTTELKSDGHSYPNKYVWEAAFDAGDDWLKDLSFVIRNVSNKKIVHMTAGCSLFETADWQAELAKHTATPIVGSITNVVGRRPEQALYSASLGRRLGPDTDRAAFELAPGQEFAIALEIPDEYPILKSRIEEKQPMSSVAACIGSISQIFFDDGTQWQSHHYLRADPDRPGHWIRMSVEEWSGVRKAAEYKGHE
jgi:hypothetical protein